MIVTNQDFFFYNSIVGRNLNPICLLWRTPIGVNFFFFSWTINLRWAVKMISNKLFYFINKNKNELKIQTKKKKKPNKWSYLVALFYVIVIIDVVWHQHHRISLNHPTIKHLLTMPTLNNRFCQSVTVSPNPSLHAKLINVTLSLTLAMVSRWQHKHLLNRKIFRK